MIKRLVFVFMFLSVALSIQAQPPRDWEAWMYSQTNGTITRINAAGNEIATVYLPLTQAFNTYGPGVNVSQNGRFVAFTAYDSTLDVPNTQLFVYDSTIDALRFTYGISTTFNVDFYQYASMLAFDENQERYAFGYVDALGWHIIVVDLVAEQVTATLDASSAGDAISSSTGDMLPVVRQIAGDQIIFTLSDSSGSALRYPAYRWNIETGEIMPDGVFTSLNGDLLEHTGEIILPMLDPEYQVVAEDSANTINVFSPASGINDRFYNDPDRVLNKVVFVQDGLEVLAKAYNPATGEISLKVIKREGEVTGELIGSLDNLRGTPDGFVGTFNTGTGIALAHVSTMQPNYAIETLWTTGDFSTVLVRVRAFGNAPTNLPEWTLLESAN